MIGPVEIVHVRDHAFVKRPQRGCAWCGRAKGHMLHVGTPKSLNVGGSSFNKHAYQAMKRGWEDRLIELLAAAGMPRCERVVVEGLMTFPDRRRRDQGNYRYMIEKALGDALVRGGWLSDDDWDRYEFGGLGYRYEAGVSATRLVLFPRVS